jgi:hypothetical protein
MQNNFFQKSHKIEINTMGDFTHFRDYRGFLCTKSFLTLMETSIYLKPPCPAGRNLVNLVNFC